jgi:hypothetical protein
MRLKILTGLFFSIGLLLMLGWPFIVGPAPDVQVEGQAAMRAYARAAVFYFGAMLISFFATVVCAWLLLRQMRKDYHDESLHNLRGLIEETLKDHGRKE